MKAGDFLSKEEIQSFKKRSDIAGAWVVFFNWVLIAAIFAGAIYWSNPLTWVVAVVLLGGRQLGLAVLMHEAGHKTLFKTDRLKIIVG